MSRLWVVGATRFSLLLPVAASVFGQVVPPGAVPGPVAPPFRLGIVDSRAVEVEILPGVRLVGLEILDVVPGSPAEVAGLGPSDIVLSANDRRIVAPDDLRRAMAVSGGRLRLKVFEVSTGQVLNMIAILGPGRPGGGSPIVTIVGRLRLGVPAIGGETTGISLTTRDGRTYDLDFRGASIPDRRADERTAVISGILTEGRGPERPGRKIIRVSDFRLLEARGPRPKDGGRPIPF
jgi:hypothetical protein